MSFDYYLKYFSGVSIFLCLLGVFWALSGSFDPFGIYDWKFAQSFWNSETLPKDAAIAKEFLLGPFGATSAAYFLLQFFIIRTPFRKKELWAYQAVVYGFFFWLILDTSICIYHQAYFNILLANVPSLLLMLPIFFTRKYFKE